MSALAARRRAGKHTAVPEDALRDLLLARATVTTPNLTEARVLVRDATLDGEELARSVHALGPDIVVVTGGHREEAADLFFDGTTFTAIPGPRHPDGAAHRTFHARVLPDPRCNLGSDS